MAAVEIKQKQEDSPAMCCGGEPYWPWGTSLEFEDELLDGLQIFDSVEIEDEVQIIATAKVVRKSERSSSDTQGTDESRSISFQLTTVEVSKKQAAPATLVDKMYRG